MQTVILDTNLWSYIADEQVRPGLDQLLRLHDLALRLSPSVLLEALRTPVPSVRRAIIEAMISGRPGRTLQSEAESEVAEITTEVRRLRPEWLLAVPDTRQADRFHRFWTKGIWQAVSADLEGFEARARLLPGLIMPLASIVAAQREQRKVIESSEVDWSGLDLWLTPDPDSNPAWYLDGWPAQERIEAWRVHNRDVFWEALARAPLRRILRYEDTTYADFMSAYVDVAGMVRSRTAFSTFWFRDVERTHVRRCWLRWAVDRAQLLTKVTEGNPRDAQHASYLCDCDLFMTADVRYARTLNRVRSAAGFHTAAVLLVRRRAGGSIVNAMGEALTAFRN